MRSSGRLPLLLVFAGSLAALAAPFGPAAAWGGVDTGAAGGALFMLVLGACIWMVAARVDSVFPEEMSVAERRTWVGLAFITLVSRSFARHLWVMSLHDSPPQRADDLFARHVVERLMPLMVA